MDRYGPGAGLTLCGLFGLVGLAVLAPTRRARSEPAPAVPPLQQNPVPEKIRRDARR